MMLINSEEYWSGRRKVWDLIDEGGLFAPVAYADGFIEVSILYNGYDVETYSFISGMLRAMVVLGSISYMDYCNIYGCIRKWYESKNNAK